MSLQFSTTYRNGILDLFDSVAGSYQTLVIYTGSPPASCADSEVGTVLIEYDLQQPSWDASFLGQKALANLPLSGTALATGTAGHFRLYDGAVNTCHMQGTVTADGGSGDLTIEDIEIVIGQTVNVTLFLLTAPGA